MKVGRTILTKTLASRLTDRKLPQEVAAYLIQERRTHELDSLIRDLEQYRADHSGIVELEAITAHSLDEIALKDIRRQIQALYPEAKQIIINQRIDPTVVGGVRLELANQQLDLTVRSKLNRFKQLTAAGKD